MANLSVIKGMGLGFDGLVVETESDGVDGLQLIVRVINKNQVFGDRNVAFPVPRGSLYIHEEYLVPFDPTIKEYAHDNPFGRLKFEGRVTAGTLEVVYVQYENVLSVSVIEILENEGKRKPGARATKKTLYSQNFTAPFSAEVKEVIETAAAEGDADDLIFALKELKEQDLNSNG